jgi:hypothetical protein
MKVFAHSAVHGSLVAWYGAKIIMDRLGRHQIPFSQRQGTIDRSSVTEITLNARSEHPVETKPNRLPDRKSEPKVFSAIVGQSWESWMLPALVRRDPRLVRPGQTNLMNRTLLARSAPT